MDWITKDTTASELIHHFEGKKLIDLINAIDYWAKLKHRDVRHKAAEMVMDIEYDGIDVVHNKIMNIDF